MIYLTTGLTSNGKTLELARTAYKLAYRNLKWYKKTGRFRNIYHNFPINQEAIKEFVNSAGESMFLRWYDIAEFLEMRECDILWDEVAVDMDSSNWANVDPEVKNFLRHHAKRGIDIYGTTQRWGSVDLNYRSIVDEMFVAHKILGSARPSATKPAVKHPWGIVWLDEQKQESFIKDKIESAGMLGWRLMFITKDLCNLYDTKYEPKRSAWPPLRHQERFCPVPNCGYHQIGKISHI